METTQPQPTPTPKCETHNRPYEMFCTMCEDRKRPMCSICMCEHNRQKHFTGTMHMTTLIRQDLEKLEEITRDSAKKKKSVAEISRRAQQLIKQKEEFRDASERKMAEFERIISEEGKLVAGVDLRAAAAYERLVSEVEKFKARIEDKNRVIAVKEKAEKVMVVEQDYFGALLEVERAGKENIKVDDIVVINACRSLEREVEQLKSAMEHVELAVLYGFEGYRTLVTANKALQENFKAEITVKQAALEKLGAESDKLREEFEKARAELKSEMKVKEKLKENVKSLESELAKAKKDYDVLVVTLKGQRIALDEKNSEFEKLKAQNEELMNTLKKKTGEVDTYFSPELADSEPALWELSNGGRTCAKAKCDDYITTCWLKERLDEGEFEIKYKLNKYPTCDKIDSIGIFPEIYKGCAMNKKDSYGLFNACINSAGVVVKTGVEYKKGDVIMLRYSSESKTLEFYVNDKLAGEIIREVPAKKYYCGVAFRRLRTKISLLAFRKKPISQTCLSGK